METSHWWAKDRFRHVFELPQYYRTPGCPSKVLWEWWNHSSFTSYSECWISKENPRSSALPLAYVLHADLLALAGHLPCLFCWGNSPVVVEQAFKGKSTKLTEIPQLMSSPESGSVTTSGTPDGAETRVCGLEVKRKCHHHAGVWQYPNSKSCLGDRKSVV